jgi:transcriptional regulator with XRE-family HTH domain
MSNWGSAGPEDARRGATIRALREAYGMPAEKLAEAVGINRRYLEYIEAGHRRANVVLCRKIADVLGVPLAAITVEGCEELGRGDGAVA